MQVKHRSTTVPDDVNVGGPMIIGVDDNAQPENRGHRWHYSKT